MGKSVDDLKTVTEIQFDPKINYMDPETAPFPFR